MPTKITIPSRVAGDLKMIYLMLLVLRLVLISDLLLELQVLSQ